MKQTISKILASAAVLAAASSCAKEIGTPSYGTDGKAICIVPEIVSAYKAESGDTSEDKSVFSNGDMIALLCDDGHTTFRLGDKGWRPTDNYYLRWGGAPVTYSAFYPAAESSTVFGNFELPSSQRTAERLASADYMTCTVADAVNPGDGKLPLRMQRQMAKVCFSLSGVESGTRVQGFRVWTSSGFTAGAPNADRMYVSPLSTAAEGSSAGENGTVYTAIIVPSEADASAQFVTFNYGGKQINLSGVPQMLAGCRYDIPVNISDSKISLGTPTVSDWDDAVTAIDGGDAEKVPLLPYFVKPQSAGTGDGLSWENAFGMAEFLNLIKQKNETDAQSEENAYNVDDRVFYFAGGTYSVSSVKVEYSGHASAVKFRVCGGYNPASAGTDISSRDISAYETVFDGAGTDKFLLLGNQTNLTFDGIVFANLYSNENSSGCIGLVAGDSGDANLNLTDCIFRKCTNDYKQYPVLWLQKGFARLSGVTFDGCRCGSDARGLIRLRNANSRVYLNSCVFVNNTYSGGFGLLGHINETGGNLCMYNVTFAGNDSGCGTQGVVNGTGGMLIASSTLAASNAGTVIRCESNPNSGSMAVNSLIIQEKDQKAIDMPSSGKKLTSLGGNIIVGSINALGQYVESTSDDIYSTVSDASALELSWTSGTHCYLWNGTTSFTKLTGEQVREAIRSYSNANTGQIKAGSTVVYDGAKAGEDFLGWLDSLGAFDTDSFGNSRDASAHWPGSWQN